MIKNALTVDVEEYFQVSAFQASIQRRQWMSYESRVEKSVDRILELLDAHTAKATFFTLGWIAEKYPQLIRKIADSGHELASHGFAHDRAFDLSPAEFYSDISAAKKILEDVSGFEVKGYRAPSFSINQDNSWAFEYIARAGYRYSSSVYPIKHDHYGMPESPRFMHRIMPDLIEVPISTIRFIGKNFPASGGGYFRLLPYAVSRWLFIRVNESDRKPVVFYFHPWEIDPGQPKVDGAGPKAQFRHYLNLERMERRLIRLLIDFNWGRMDQIFLHSAVTDASYSEARA